MSPQLGTPRYLLQHCVQVCQHRFVDFRAFEHTSRNWKYTRPWKKISRIHRCREKQRQWIIMRNRPINVSWHVGLHRRDTWKNRDRPISDNGSVVGWSFCLGWLLYLFFPGFGINIIHGGGQFCEFCEILFQNTCQKSVPTRDPVDIRCVALRVQVLLGLRVSSFSVRNFFCWAQALSLLLPPLRAAGWKKMPLACCLCFCSSHGFSPAMKHLPGQSFKHQAPPFPCHFARKHVWWYRCVVHAAFIQHAPGMADHWWPSSGNDVLCCFCYSKTCAPERNRNSTVSDNDILFCICCSKTCAPERKALSANFR